MILVEAGEGRIAERRTTAVLAGHDVTNRERTVDLDYKGTAWELQNGEWLKNQSGQS
jgi:hypothetical protein